MESCESNRFSTKKNATTVIGLIYMIFIYKMQNVCKYKSINILTKYY